MHMIMKDFARDESRECLSAIPAVFESFSLIDFPTRTIHLSLLCKISPLHLDKVA